jgi:hypothetical protein
VITRDDVIKAIAQSIDASDVCKDFGPFRINQAMAVLSAIEALGVRLVPVEPTKEMIEAAWYDGGPITNDYINLTWTYMLLASPLSHESASS